MARRGEALAAEPEAGAEDREAAVDPEVSPDFETSFHVVSFLSSLENCFPLEEPLDQRFRSCDNFEVWSDMEVGQYSQVI